MAFHDREKISYLKEVRTTPKPYKNKKRKV